jgi:hypothetical protein
MPVLLRFAAALLLIPSLALAQGSILQAGPPTGGHAPMYTPFGGLQAVIQDSGPASGGQAGLGLSELLQVARSPNASSGTGPMGTHECMYDAPVASGSYHFLCFDPNAQGGGLIDYGAAGTATPLPLQFMVNGAVGTNISNVSTSTITANGITQTAAAWAGYLAGAANPNPVVLGNTLSVAGIGTFTGAVTMPELTSVQPGQSSGNAGANVFYNQMDITADQANSGSANNVVDGLRLDLTVAGANASGARQVIDSNLNFNAPTSSTNTNRNYVAVNGFTNVNSGDGGTSTTPQGAFFGGNLGVRVNAGTNIGNVTGLENDVVMQAGTSSKWRMGFSSVSWGFVSGSVLDAAYSVGATNIGGSNTSWVDAILLTNGNGIAPLNSSLGCVICTDGSFNTIQRGMDLESYNITGNFLAGPAGNFTVAGATGNVATLGTIAPSSTKGIVGTTAGDNAQAGSIGESLGGGPTTATATTAVAMNATSLSLTPGDWQVWGVCQFNPAGTTTVSLVICGVGGASAAFGGVGSFQELASNFPTGGAQAISTPQVRANLTTTTPVFLVAESTFGVSTMSVTGVVFARRVR